MPENKTEYDPFDDDLPRVQIPLGADRAGLSIEPEDGGRSEFVGLMEMPQRARQAYIQYAEQGGEVRIYQCDNCGYLSDADAFSATTYNRAYECGGCGARLCGTTQHGSNESATQVHGPLVGETLSEERAVDVAAMVTDTKCEAGHGPTIAEEAGRYGTAEVNQEAVDCPHCVPNHPSHLGQLKKKAGGLTRNEMMREVAEAVKEFREA